LILAESTGTIGAIALGGEIPMPYDPNVRARIIRNVVADVARDEHQIDRYIDQIWRLASTRVHPSHYQALDHLSYQAGVALRRIARKAHV
jgi:hypothetical protein